MSGTRARGREISSLSSTKLGYLFAFRNRWVINFQLEVRRVGENFTFTKLSLKFYFPFLLFRVKKSKTRDSFR